MTSHLKDVTKSTYQKHKALYAYKEIIPHALKRICSHGLLKKFHLKASQGMIPNTLK